MYGNIDNIRENRYWTVLPENYRRYYRPFPVTWNGLHSRSRPFPGAGNGFHSGLVHYRHPGMNFIPVPVHYRLPGTESLPALSLPALSVAGNVRA